MPFGFFILQVVLAIVALAALAYAAWRHGGPSERWGTAIIATSWTMDAVIEIGTASAH